MVRPHIDVGRVNRRLDHLWEIGSTNRGGVTRLAYSEKESEAIDYLCNELDPSFDIRTDKIGNVYATPDSSAEKSLFLGSHLDTVFNGGRLDGTLGLVTALEAIEAVMASDREFGIPPTLAIFRAEESSRFGQHTIGSRGALGMLTAEDLAATDHSDVPLWEAMLQAGFDPQNLSTSILDPTAIEAYLELHIEQGRVLDEADDDIAIVSSIRAPVRYQVTVTGADDHSGATPMDLRQDAIAAAAEMISAIERLGVDASDEGDIVTTVGDITVPDGAVNKVCGKVSFPIDIRSNDLAHRDEVEERIIDMLTSIACQRNVNLEYDLLDRSEPVIMDDTIIEWLSTITDSLSVPYRIIPSGGGHDAMNFEHANIPAGLIFVPSLDGVSHNPAEETTEEAIVAGTTLLANALITPPPITDSQN